ncbi:MAG: chorismate-binding protein, partial [Candidatus Margulisbacteria bacterium]|nr:chorismate-binding protein [Candidatus Margulisiibacteriota bacterium]
MQVLIEFEKKPLLFDNPLGIIETNKLSEVKACFTKMEDALIRGYYLAGIISYEAGYAFEQKLLTKDDFDFPLIMLGVYNSPKDQRLTTNDQRLTTYFLNLHGYNLTQNQYCANIQAIKDNIAAGETYQITFCTKLKFDFSGDTFLLYKRLLKRQPVPYPAFIKTNDFSILSLSPEMFMRKSGNFITTKPMKGTWPREKA